MDVKLFCIILIQFTYFLGMKQRKHGEKPFYYLVFYGPIIETVYIQGNIYRKYIIRQDMHNVKSYSVSLVSITSESIVSLSPYSHIFKLPLFLLSQANSSLSLLLLLFVRVQVFSGQKKIGYIMNRCVKARCRRRIGVYKQ